MDAIDLCEMKGLPFFNSQLKIDGLMQGDGSLKDYNMIYGEANLTIRVPEPRQHFFIDMIGVA